MLQYKIFLGSSFKLMRIRRQIGDAIRQLNDKWLLKGVRIKLFIWEDFIIGYSGKHKQQEYIDEMVLKSDLCIFMFSDRVGKFTQMELDAKLKQDKDSVYCYRLPVPKNGKYNPAVVNDLNTIGVAVEDISDAVSMCKKVEAVVEEYIKNKGVQKQDKLDMKNKYFYTTIPDDLQNIQNSIGTTFRELNDECMDSLGVHCILYPRKQKPLMDATDHYIPILKEKASEDDLEELKYGIQLSSDKESRMERMTVFDLGNIFKDNAEVKSLLDAPGLFTDKVSGLDGLNWKLYKWVSHSEQRMATETSVGVDNGNVTVNNKPIVPIAAIDCFDAASKISEKKTQIDKERDSAILNKEDEKAVKFVTESNILQENLVRLIVSEQNEWIKESYTESAEEKNLLNRIGAIEKETDVINDPQTQIAKLEEGESILRSLVEKQCIPPHRLLRLQLKMVSLYDTYLLINGMPPKEENVLFARITQDADRFGMKEPFVEMCRMNFANMYVRNEQYDEARELYRVAIIRLMAMRDESVTIARCLSSVFMHRITMEVQSGTHQSYLETLDEFKNHVGSLDLSNDAFVVDQCQLAAAELIGIDIEDTTSLDIVQSAEILYNEAVEKKVLSVHSMEYMDVFIYLPNMIARYYIDHADQFEPMLRPTIDEKIESLLNSAWDNCQQLKTVDYHGGLFFEGELLHQKAFFYSNNPQKWMIALEMYASCLDVRRRNFKLTGNMDEEPQIAQTLVNYGGLEMLILEHKDKFQPNRQVILNPLEKANEALEIYSRHIKSDDENSHCEYYQALQLRGTVYYFMFREKPEAIVLYNQAIHDLFECWTWNKNHLNNQYRRKFLDFAGQILLERGIISKAEYEEVRTLIEKR